MISNYTATISIGLAVLLSSIGGAATAQQPNRLQLSLDHSTLLKGSASISSEIISSAKFTVWIVQAQESTTGFSYYIHSFGPIGTYPSGTADESDVLEYWVSYPSLNVADPSNGVTFDSELPFDVYITSKGSANAPLKVKVTKFEAGVPVLNTIESRHAFVKKSFPHAQTSGQISVKWK